MRFLAVLATVTSLLTAAPRLAAAWSCDDYQHATTAFPRWGQRTGTSCALAFVMPAWEEVLEAGDVRLVHGEVPVEIPIELRHEPIDVIAWYGRCDGDCEYQEWTESVQLRYYEITPLEPLPPETRVVLERVPAGGSPWQLVYFEVGTEADVCASRDDVTDPYCYAEPCEYTYECGEQAPPEDPVEDEPAGGGIGGCDSGGAGAGPWLLAAMALTLRRRRRAV